MTAPSETDRPVESDSPVRNSRLRVLTKPFQPAAEWLVRHHVTANKATFAGMGLTMIGSLGALAVNTHPEWGIHPALPIAPTLLGGSLDIADGMLARAEDRLFTRSPGDKILGKLFDVGSDRFASAFTAFLRAEVARSRGDVLGKHLAVANAVAQTLPSITRAMSEVAGLASPELAIGSYLPRWVLGVIATHFPTESGQPVQVVSDGLATTLSLITAGKRLGDLLAGRGKRISSHEQHEAIAKLIFLLGITTFVVIAAVSYETSTSVS